MTELLLHREIHGSRGPYLLLVHGILSSRAQWRPNLDALCSVARPVVVELLGHGRSASPEAPDLYSPDRYVREFERIRKDLGAERWFVCGTSLGAALTLRYALEHPRRVVAHAFTNTNSALADANWVASTRAAMQQFATAVETEGRTALERMPVHPRHARRLTAELKQALVSDAQLHSPLGVARSALVTVVESSLRERIAATRVPTLMLQGTRERRFAEAAEYARTTLPNLESIGIDAGHAVNLEAPEEFNAALVDWVRRFGAPPAL